MASDLLAELRCGCLRSMEHRATVDAGLALKTLLL
jgi:hypothetical protein